MSCHELHVMTATMQVPNLSIDELARPQMQAGPAMAVATATAPFGVNNPSLRPQDPRQGHSGVQPANPAQTKAQAQPPTGASQPQLHVYGFNRRCEGVQLTSVCTSVLIGITWHNPIRARPQHCKQHRDK